jgi:nucleotide-binding universal stress UspA family protein
VQWNAFFIRKEIVMNYLKILFTVDLSEQSYKIAPHVAKVCNALNAEIHVLFVISDIMGNPSHAELDSGQLKTNSDVLKEAQRNLEMLVESSFLKNRCKVYVSCGDPAEKILKYASKENIDIIIVGSKGPVAGRPLHGRMVQRVIRESPVDVWTFTADGGPIKELRL